MHNVQVTMLIKNDLKANIESRPRVDIACDKTLNCRILLCPITSSAKEHYKRQSVHYEQLDGWYKSKLYKSNTNTVKKNCKKGLTIHGLVKTRAQLFEGRLVLNWG